MTDNATHHPQQARCIASNWRRTWIIALAALLLLGVFYVGKTWSPSSYGHVFANHLGYPQGGPDWGSPRPIRSDEWAVVTPLTQATVRNHFERYNRTSLYGEDLRINYGLPIHDWGFAFKPTMWLYGVVNPAYAYSAHWFLIFALFLLGYAGLFRWLGATPIIAFALSGGLYFTGFVQFWWNEKGPIFAFFPWLVLAMASRLPLLWRAVLFYWLAVCWFLTNFYPPIQVSLVFVALALLIAQEPALVKPKPLLLFTLAAALAAATAAFYLWDYLSATSTTLYPGHRRVGGGAVPLAHLLSWLWPALTFTFDYRPLYSHLNICENGVPGLYYLPLALCFANYAAWPAAWADPAFRRRVTVLAVALAMMFAWLILPLPAWLGTPLLWNHVQPGRMQFAAGLLMLCGLFVLVQALGLHFTLRRAVVFAALLGLAWGAWTWHFDPQGALRGRHFEDLAFLLLLPPVIFVARRRPPCAHASMALASLLAGALLFGRFNPLQPAWPIFNPPRTTTLEIFDQLAADNDGVLAVVGLSGAVGNGLGYRSLSHVTAVPQLAFWRKQFPDLAEDEFSNIFNRYSHIIPTDAVRPHLRQADALEVPVSIAQHTAPVRYLPGIGELRNIERMGHVDKITVEANRLVIVGWGAWSGPPRTHELEIVMTPAPTGTPVQTLVVRPDLPPATDGKVSALNGFSLAVPMPTMTGTSPPALCLFAFDPLTGKRTLLHNPPGQPYCTSDGAK